MRSNRINTREKKPEFSIAEPVNVYWFRRDLRLDDNAGLDLALREEIPLQPVFIFDSVLLNGLQKDDARVSFIHRTVTELDRELRKYGSCLQVFYGDPVEVFGDIKKAFPAVRSVFCNRDYEPYALNRDQKVESSLKAKGIFFIQTKDQYIFEPHEIVKHDRTPYSVFTPYKKKWLQAVDSQLFKAYPSEKRIQKNSRALLQNVATADARNTDIARIPSLDEIGFIESAIPIPPVKIPNKIIENYAGNRDYPGIEGTTKLGIHLRFGSVSIRKLAGLAEKSSEVFLSELIWREFYMMILWHFPYVVDRPFKSQYENIMWRENEEDFEKWCQGQTGYSLVDAGMNELNTTGFMHNRVRMVVASFLTKHLLIDWKKGERYFADKLLDYELASNNGNWQWVAGCGCDAAPYFRIFNPMTQAEKFDPDRSYREKWLKNSPSYRPIIDHKVARQRCLAAYKQGLDREKTYRSKN